jgi:hypothetical protein
MISMKQQQDEGLTLPLSVMLPKTIPRKHPCIFANKTQMITIKEMPL